MSVKDLLYKYWHVLLCLKHNKSDIDDEPNKNDVILIIINHTKKLWKLLCYS